MKNDLKQYLMDEITRLELLCKELSEISAAIARCYVCNKLEKQEDLEFVDEKFVCRNCIFNYKEEIRIDNSPIEKTNKRRWMEE